MTVKEAPDSTPERLVVETTYDRPPLDVWRAFVDEHLIAQWWADEASTDPRVGGEIVASWPAMDWTMRGTFTDLRPGQRVAFTWSWDHESDTPERLVTVVLAPHDGGTLLTLTHGDYAAGDTDERDGHLAGWKNFLPAIAGLDPS